MAKDPRFERLPCTHEGVYADDCIVNRITMVLISTFRRIKKKQHKCYIVATCDKDLKRRIRKVPGVPIMYISNRKYTIERLPEAFGGKFPRKFIFNDFRSSELSLNKNLFLKIFIVHFLAFLEFC
jgi:U3 small nucleolar RNA-associated protein 24